MKIYKSEDGLVYAIGRKTYTDILCINMSRIVLLPPYDNIGQPSNTGQNVSANYQ